MADAHEGAERFRWLSLNWHACPPEERPARFGFQCPRGRGWCSGLLIEGAIVNGDRLVRTGQRPHCWTWNGSRDRPTFHPSINCLAHNPQNPAEKYAGCGWHGWIRDGELTEAGAPSRPGPAAAPVGPSVYAQVSTLLQQSALGIPTGELERRFPSGLPKALEKGTRKGTLILRAGLWHHASRVPPEPRGLEQGPLPGAS